MSNNINYNLIKYKNKLELANYILNNLDKNLLGGSLNILNNEFKRVHRFNNDSLKNLLFDKYKYILEEILRQPPKYKLEEILKQQQQQSEQQIKKPVITNEIINTMYQEIQELKEEINIQLDGNLESLTKKYEKMEYKLIKNLLKYYNNILILPDNLESSNWIHLLNMYCDYNLKLFIKFLPDLDNTYYLSNNDLQEEEYDLSISQNKSYEEFIEEQKELIRAITVESKMWKVLVNKYTTELVTDNNYNEILNGFQMN